MSHHNLEYHLKEVKKGNRKFENVFQSLSRMIFEQPNAIEKKIVKGELKSNFKIFRQGKKHLIGMYDELTTFSNFVRDASENGSSKEMAFVLVGEPGNGKTLFAEYLCSAYRDFLSEEKNRRYTFRFTGLDKMPHKYENILDIESQTFEDPMILALNLNYGEKETEKFLKDYGFDKKQIKKIKENYRPLGACSDYILEDIREYCEGDIKKMLEFVKIVPVPISPTRGILTGKYAAKDKITASSTELLGEESMQRILSIKDSANPYRIDLRVGALARVAGGGIHFSDELFKNKRDLVQIYLGVIQDRVIELNGFKWPIDTLIIATSNNEEYQNFLSEKSEAPILDRCKICFVPHNTDYKLQEELTKYALGSKNKTTFLNEPLHIDPNLSYAASVAAVLTRLPSSNELTPIEMMKLSAGEIAEDKSITTLVDIIEKKKKLEVGKRFGQTGIGQRSLSRALQLLMEQSKTQEGKCMFAKDVFDSLEQIIYNEYAHSPLRKKYLKDVSIAKKLYRERINQTMFNALMDDPKAIGKQVLNYVNMIIGSCSMDLGNNQMWRYKDPQTGKMQSIKVDEGYLESVESRMGIKTQEERDAFRTSITKIYSQKIHTDKNYSFMDNQSLVKAITEIRLESDIAGEKNLRSALLNQSNEETKGVREKIFSIMRKKLGHCNTCAQKTIEYYCINEDQ